MPCRCFLLAFLPFVIALAAAAEPVDYDQDIRPFLKDNCVACHNKTTTKGGLNMETPALMSKGGESGGGLVPGKAADSIIYQAAAQAWDSEMPPKNNKVGALPLTAAQLAKLKAWIDQGARASAAKEQSIAWQPLPAGLQPIYALAVAGQGDYAAAARGNQVSVYHLPTASLVTKLTDDTLLKSGLYQHPGVAHRDLVQAIAFSPDGSLLATGGFREVKLWRRKMGAVSTAPSAAMTVTQDADGSIKLIAAKDAKVMAHVKTTLAHSRQLESLTLASARAVMEVAAQTEAIKRAEAELAAQEARLKKARELAAAAQKSVEEKTKDVKAKTEAWLAADKAVPPAAPQPDDKALAAARQKAEKAAADLAAAQEALQRAEHAVADTAQEIQVVTANAAKARQDVADAKGRLEVLKKAQAAASAERDAFAKAPQPPLPKAQSLGLSANGLEIIAAPASVPPLAWSTLDGRPIEPGSTTATWALERTLGSPAGQSPISDRANSLAFSADGKTLAVGSGEPSRTGDITLWEVATGKLTTTYAERHLDSVLALEFSPDGKLLASGGADKMVRVTEIATGKVVKVYEGHTHHILSLSWRADGRLLASAGADNVVKIWDWTTGERRKSVEGWDKEVTGVRYLGATDQIITCAGDSKVRLLTSDGTEVRQLRGAASFMQALSATASGAIVLSGDQDGVVRVWEAATAKEVAVFKP